MSATSALVGTIVGLALKTAYDYFTRSLDRRDKYFFALLTKRFEVYQTANSICEELKAVVHDETDKNTEATKKAMDWFHKNNLYLSPALRNDLWSLIMDVGMYDNQLQSYRSTLHLKGPDDEETKKTRDELKDTWKRIMKETQEKLQNDLDYYFQILEK